MNIFRPSAPLCARAARRLPGAAPLILLASPNAATLAIWEELLVHVGYATIACQTSQAVVQCLTVGGADLLLTADDLAWYGARGELRYLVRERSAAAAPPVVLTTTDPRAQRSQLQIWGCQILADPFSASELWTAVATTLTSASLRSRVAGG